MSGDQNWLHTFVTVLLKLPVKICVFLIRGYQKTSRFRPPMCRFQPSCSEYMAQAIIKFGVVKGVALGSWRLLRCNPFNKGGSDPVP